MASSTLMTLSSCLQSSKYDILHSVDAVILLQISMYGTFHSSDIVLLPSEVQVWHPPLCLLTLSSCLQSFRYGTHHSIDIVLLPSVLQVWPPPFIDTVTAWPLDSRAPDMPISTVLQCQAVHIRHCLLCLPDCQASEMCSFILSSCRQSCRIPSSILPFCRGSGKSASILPY